jgi:murein DD-endopeptidase MepM/ murein hydrolase activator NlpD
VISVGTVGFTGYSGDNSFVCRPLVDAPYVPLTDTFGTYRTATYNHSGIDFGTNYSNGHPVITPMGGKVTYTGIYGGWGYTMVIENDGYQVLLTHAQDMLYEVGDIVTAGDTVLISGGGVGDSRDGSSTGPHLHFETRKCEESSDGNVYCKAYDPDGIILPGQNDNCTWTQQTIIPEQ